jgi:sulfite reductase beta subunit-like hemoprotein
VAKFRAEVEQALGRALPTAGSDARSNRRADHIGIFRQKGQGLNYVGLSVPVGRLHSEQLLDACQLAERYGTGEVRLTPGQNLIIPHVPDQKIGDLTAEPLLQVLRYDPSELRRGLVSCTGIEFCNLAVIETKQRALTLAHELEQVGCGRAAHHRLVWLPGWLRQSPCRRHRFAREQDQSRGHGGGCRHHFCGGQGGQRGTLGGENHGGRPL